MTLQDLRPPVPTDVLASLLKFSPMIQDLAVVNSISTNSALELVPFVLPRLRQLRILQDLTRDVQSLYSALIHPASTKVDITSQQPIVSPEDFSNIRSIMDLCGVSTRLLSNQRISPAMHLRCAYGSTWMHLGGHDTALTPALAGFRTGELTLKVYTSGHLQDLQVQGVQELFFETEVGTLNFSPTETDSVRLQTVIQNHPEITSLQFSGPEIKDAINVLNRRCDPPQAMAVLPSLQVLKLNNEGTRAGEIFFNIGGRRLITSFHTIGSWHIPDDGAESDALKDLLRTRIEETALRELHLSSLKWMDSGKIAELRRLADSRGTVVFWDGEAGSDS